MSGPGPRLVGLGAADPLERAGARVLAKGGASGASSQQTRTFTLLERVNAAWQQFRFPHGRPADTDPTTLDTGISAQAKSYQFQEYFKVDNSRLQCYEDMKEMDETNDEIAAGLDTLADSAVNPEDGGQHTFVIEIDEGPYRDAAEAVFDQVTESCDLHALAFDIARDFLKFGDCFTELVVDESRKLARLKILPPGTLWRNEDAAGNLQEGRPAYDAEGHCANQAGECAFDQREALNGRLIASFYAWQITHFRWNRRGTERYGRALLRTARLTWKKLKAAEESLIIARLQRAWMRFVHTIDTTGMTTEEARQAVMRYRQELTRKFIVDTQMRESPFEVTSDFYLAGGYIRDLDGAKFLPKHAKIEVLQGDHAVLAAIHDIEYFQNKLFASLRIPKAYLGFERDVNSKSTLTTQDVQFARVLRRVQNVLSQGYKEIFDFGLALAGIDPTQVHYAVRWPAILVSDEERDAIIRRFHAQSDATYWQMGAPSTKYLIQQRYGMDDEAWRMDLLDAMGDPPARLKIPAMQMPATQMTVGTPGAATLADAVAAAGGQGPVTDVPPDDFDQSRASTEVEQRAADIARDGGGDTKTLPGRKRGTPAHLRGSNPAGMGGRPGAQVPQQSTFNTPFARSPGAARAGGREEEEEELAGMAPFGALFDPEDDAAALEGLGYEPELAQALGDPFPFPAATATPSAPSSRTFVPGARGLGGADARSPMERREALRRIGSVAGVHGVSPLSRAAGATSSAHVAGRAARDLQSFVVDLARRKAAGPVRGDRD